MTRVKVTLPDQRVVDATQVFAESSVEQWTEIVFENGVKIRLKATLDQMTIPDGEFNENGDPFLIMTANCNMVVAFVPENLKRPKQ